MSTFHFRSRIWDLNLVINVLCHQQWHQWLQVRRGFVHDYLPASVFIQFRWNIIQFRWNIIHHSTSIKSNLPFVCVIRPVLIYWRDTILFTCKYTDTQSRVYIRHYSYAPVICYKTTHCGLAVGGMVLVFGFKLIKIELLIKFSRWWNLRLVKCYHGSTFGNGANGNEDVQWWTQ